jgi:hypothetical protein
MSRTVISSEERNLGRRDFSTPLEVTILRNDSTF